MSCLHSGINVEYDTGLLSLLSSRFWNMVSKQARAGVYKIVVLYFVK